MSRLMLFAVVWLALGCSRAPGPTPAPVPAPAPAVTEESAIAFVEKLGGTVTRDETQPGRPVIDVSLRGTNATDADLKEIAPFKNLTTLDLSLAPVTGAGMKELAPFKNLTYLFLADTKVTDEGMKELAAQGTSTNST